MKLRLPILHMAALSGCSPVCDVGSAASTAHAGSKTLAAPPVNSDETTFLATVTTIQMGNVRDPYLRWVVTLKIDEVVSGTSPGDGFWFLIHSPSQDGVKVGHRYTMSVRKKGDGYETISHERLP